MNSKIALLAASLAAFGCSTSQKKAADDDFSKFVGQALDSATVTSQIEILGTLSYGSLSPHVSYVNPLRYRAFTFVGSAADKVDIWVRSGNGDPIAWLFDANFNFLGKNDDADSQTNDAHILRTLSSDGICLIVFRDFELWPADMVVGLERDPAATDGGLFPVDLAYHSPTDLGVEPTDLAHHDTPDLGYPVDLAYHYPVDLAYHDPVDLAHHDTPDLAYHTTDLAHHNTGEP